MANFFSVSLLLVALTTAATTLRLTSAAETLAPFQPPSPPEIPPSPTPSPAPSAVTPQSPSPQPTPAADQDTHLRNILDALIGTGDYGGWANLLSSANPSDLPLTATLFIPSNDAISGLLSASTTAATVRLDPLLVPYHIVPQRLTFSDLQDLTPRTSLPTLLPANFIVVSNNSPTNFTVDGAQITQADIFLNAAFALHGIDKVLNYSVFGDGDDPLPPPPTTLENNSSLPRKKKIPRGMIVGVRSGAWRSFARTPMILFMIFTFKIL